MRNQGNSVGNGPYGISAHSIKIIYGDLINTVKGVRVIHINKLKVVWRETNG